MSIDEKNLKRLEYQLDELIQRMENLKRENLSLRENQAALLGERSRLLTRTEEARVRMEKMISRLKAMEEGQ